MNNNLKNSILVVDDSKTSLMIISQLLEEKYTTYACTNINDALEILKKYNISLILLDVVMPDIDGYESCKIIKSHAEYKEIPIIFSTSMSEEQAIEKAFEVGGVDYIIKPLRKSEILGRVKTHLEIYNQRIELNNKNKDINEYLKQQTKMSMMGEMIENIAHQWRQPLNFMNSSISIALFKKQMGELSDKDLEETLNSLTKKVNYLSETINTFRNFINQDKTIIAVNIQDTIKNSIDLSMSVLKDNHIELKTSIVPEELIIKAPFGELTQVFVNLFNNAKDALLSAKKENPWIYVSLEKSENRAVISVEDNAGGIPKEIMEKVFDSKFTTKGKEGTGLGLYMSKQIIEESLNGKIYLENTENGAKFFINLPIE